MSDTIDPRYPVGKFEKPASVEYAARMALVAEIEQLPKKLRAAVAGLTEAQLNEPYREGGWTVRQVVHHLPDSHMNAYIRFKLALTETEPTIKTYAEALWANLPDARIGPIDPSLSLLEAVHRRWVAAIRALPDELFARTYIHPDDGKLDLNDLLAVYAWHGRHHLAHITTLKQAKGWR